MSIKNKWALHGSSEKRKCSVWNMTLNHFLTHNMTFRDLLLTRCLTEGLWYHSTEQFISNDMGCSIRTMTPSVWAFLVTGLNASTSSRIRVLNSRLQGPKIMWVKQAILEEKVLWTLKHRSHMKQTRIFFLYSKQYACIFLGLSSTLNIPFAVSR